MQAITLMNNMKNTMKTLATQHSDNLLFRIANSAIWHLLAVVSIMLCTYSTQLYAETQTDADPKVHQIYLMQHDFEFDSYTASPGDIIEIINQSDISHSVYIETPDGTIINIDEKLYVQTPGVSVRWKVPEFGEFTLRCWIHPVIHATLLIPEPTDKNAY